MRLRLPSGRRILVAPVFFWESPRDALCVVRTTGAFHPAHPTTRMCLDLLENHLQEHVCKTLLDVGCGSGVLALAAAALGIDRCVGLDIDHRAVRLARANAADNDLDTRTLWFTGSCGALRGVFDCVMANLPFEVLMVLLEDLARLTAESGTLILSGFHDIHWHEVAAELDRLGLQVLRDLTRDQSFYGVPPSGSFTWKALAARRKGWDLLAARAGSSAIGRRVPRA